MCAWFLEIALARALVCLRVCPPLRPFIASHMTGTCNNRIMRFYTYSVSLYNTAIDKLNRRGLSNTLGRKCLSKKSQVMRY